MENLYDSLQCESTASHDQIRKSYQTLALKHHPDKAGENHTSVSSEEFIKINRAWKILSDPKLREQYDVRWAERCLAQSYPIQDTIEFEQFDLLDNDGSDLHTELCSDLSKQHGVVVEYGYECRCGGYYILTNDDVEMKFDLVCCDSCSLTVKVLYNEDIVK